MATEAKKKAKNEQDAATSIRWLSSHPEYKRIPSNTDAMYKRWLEKKFTDWTEESLEIVFEELKAEKGLDLFTPEQVAENARQLREKLNPKPITKRFEFAE
jgi:hypothetical protein